MNERLLQFIWQQQHYAHQELCTVTGDPLVVIHRGQLNRDQGPDFQMGRIRIRNTEWVGAIELHCKTSDWYRHRHQHDPGYQKVILHVVWENDLAAVEESIPVLELQGRVPRSLIQRYHQWMATRDHLPCGHQIRRVPSLVRLNWLDRMAAERLISRSTAFIQKWQQPNGCREELFWQLMARTFGGLVNGDAFEEVVRIITFPVLRRHAQQIHQLEALLLGQAGLLSPSYREAYPAQLRNDFMLLKQKYRLPEPVLPVHFLRMRPIAFPTIRLAQLAMLIHSQANLFDLLIGGATLSELEQAVTVSVTDYWHGHYRFEEPSVRTSKLTGKQFCRSVLLNACCPVIFALGKEGNQPALMEKAVAWMTQLAPEQNPVVNRFVKAGMPVSNSLESQACLQLKTNYCDRLRCLECSIGTYLLNHRE